MLKSERLLIVYLFCFEHSLYSLFSCALFFVWCDCIRFWIDATSRYHIDLIKCKLVCARLSVFARYVRNLIYFGEILHRLCNLHCFEIGQTCVVFLLLCFYFVLFCFIWFLVNGSTVQLCVRVCMLNMSIKFDLQWVRIISLFVN